GRMLYSTDNGASWKFIPNAGNVFFNVGRTTLGVARAGESIVYAFAANPDGIAQRDLFKSIDGGLNWAALGITGKVPTNPDAAQPNMNLMGFQSWYNQTILVDPSDSSHNLPRRPIVHRQDGRWRHYLDVAIRLVAGDFLEFALCTRRPSRGGDYYLRWSECNRVRHR